MHSDRPAGRPAKFPGERLSDDPTPSRSERALGLTAAAALLLGGWRLSRVAGCPDERTANFTPADVQLELARRHLSARPVPDAGVAARGGVILQTAIGSAGAIAVIWQDDGTHYLFDDPTWGSRITPSYERESLNVTFYALRGGSEPDKARMRDTFSRMIRHLYPARPLACQDE